VGDSYTSLATELLQTSRVSRAGWALACAASWVALEMAQARLLTGFPWNLLGASQYTILPLVQIASLTGVFGISFLIVWCSTVLAMLALMITRMPAQRPRLLGDLLPPTIALTVAWTWGAAEVWRKIETPVGPTIQIAMVQPSVPQTLIWDGKEDRYRFNKLLALSQEAVAGKPDLLLWPEAAVPGMLRYDTNILQAVTNLAMSNQVWMVIGSDDAEPGAAAGAESFFNSAFLISPQGEILDRYSKRHLVAFGEYVPLTRWLPFLQKFTPVGEGFTPGRGPRQFRFKVGLSNTIPVQAGILICFEDLLPRLARESVEPDTDFILNLTNDGWFRESAAQWQHAASAVFRAVETGRPLVRCTNNGRTCWVDAAGRIREVETSYATDKQDIYSESVRLARIPLITSRQGPLPLYHRHGDWFGWSCVATAVGLLGTAFLRRKTG
jgi:apolipoprotein N-acyltransferase